ncbi:MAG: hypothetical protein J4F29_17670 [Candidatus Latescibacteria bacterium]|nr:hypothetical protein [Candidatus Latescibacterota bacterium]
MTDAEPEKQRDADIALEPATVIVNPWKQHVPPHREGTVVGSLRAGCRKPAKLPDLDSQ